jgi:hypothetical protein
MRFKRRLERLERQRDVGANGLLPLPRFWSLLLQPPNSLDTEDRALLESLLAEGKAEAARRSEDGPNGKRYRAELTRLGLPQPPTLAGINLIEEVIRLAGIPTPNAMK